MGTRTCRCTCRWGLETEGGWEEIFEILGLACRAASQPVQACRSNPPRDREGLRGTENGESDSYAWYRWRSNF